MPFTQVSLDRLAQVHAKLAAAIQQMDAAAPEISLQVTQGLRSWIEQEQLYAQGRSAPGKIVTNVRGGYSWHNYGLAVYLVPEDIQPGQPDWNITHPAWSRLWELGRQVGLVEGVVWRTFPDAPHFQLTGKFPMTPNDEVRQLFGEGGILAVWNESGL